MPPRRVPWTDVLPNDTAQVAEEIQHRVINLFARDHEGNRACNGGSEVLNKDPHFRDYVPFHEFFHADTGKGLGASHQTGWTGCACMLSS